jgi:acyl-CoA synthetase (AMP-forming)/AMP-acid ligase II
MGRLHPDGRLQLLGRGSQCINTGGEKVFPEEVEQVLRAHPKIYDAVVTGAPDPQWGQRVTAIIATADGQSLTIDEVRAHCRSALAAFKVPKDVTFIEEIRRTAAGKPDYVWAAAVTASRASSARGTDH